MTGGSGYGAPGELLCYTFDADGSVASIRGPSATTMVPLERFTLPERVTVGWLDKAPEPGRSSG